MPEDAATTSLAVTNVSVLMGLSFHQPEMNASVSCLQDFLYGNRVRICLSIHCLCLEIVSHENRQRKCFAKACALNF